MLELGRAPPHDDSAIVVIQISWTLVVYEWVEGMHDRIILAFKNMAYYQASE